MIAILSIVLLISIDLITYNNAITSFFRLWKRSLSISSSSMLSLDEIGLTSINTFTTYLIDDNDNDNDNNDNDGRDSIAVLATSSSLETLREDYVISSNVNIHQTKPRQVYRSHFTYTVPEKVPSPSLVCVSLSCCQLIGLSPHEILKEKFILAFTGNILLPGLDRPYSTVYGSHVFGRWNGQLGDGRVIVLGDVINDDKRYEIQLKGAGRTPFGRGFDGRAVLRSCIREYLASEAMYHLNVETTRALAVFETGMDIRRPWYKENSKDIAKNTTRRGPDHVSYEKGAIVVRISPTYIRFGQIELFAVREEYKEMLNLVNFAIYREYPELLNMKGTEELSTNYLNSFQDPTLYVNLMYHICNTSSHLVADWMRVGYTQGNMNSDNVLIRCRTLDYGPFGFMETFDPSYQPFTSDSERKYSFYNQSNAMNVNVKILGQCIGKLVDYYCSKSGIDSKPYLDSIDRIVTLGFDELYTYHYNKVRGAKLGFVKFDECDYPVWDELLLLLHRSQADYTIFFRQLSLAADCESGQDAFLKIQNAFSEEVGDNDKVEWIKWFDNYIERIKIECMNPLQRKDKQNLSNPKFIPRQWMLTLAYEEAAKNDFRLVNEIHELLCHPYDEQSDEMAKYFTTTPEWARQMPGSAFMN